MCLCQFCHIRNSEGKVLGKPQSVTLACIIIMLATQIPGK